MKAILSEIVINVDGEATGVNTREVDIKDYKDYYPLLKCSNFDVVMPNDEMSIFVDDEGMLKSKNYGRMVDGYPEPLFGNLVFCGGVDSKGETLDTPLQIHDVKFMVGDIRWVTR